MGNPLPTECGKKFKLNSAGNTPEEAKENALASARNICRSTFGNKCSNADEAGPSSIEQRGGLYIYYSTYICVGI